MRSSLLEDLTGRFRGGSGKEPTPETPDGDGAGDSLGDAEWPSQVHAHSLRLRPLTALLSVALIALAGIWGGAELQKRHGSGTTASGNSGLAAALASRFGNRTGGTGGFGGGFGGGAAAGGGATSGTVTEVTTKTLYLTTSTGALVKVGLTKATTFTRTAKSPKGGLALGDTAIVIGAKNAKGLIVATSVIATQKGVTVARGGFGGGGFGGGGNAAGGGAAGG